MSCIAAPPQLDPLRYEILPFAAGERAASLLSAARTLTVTCSPRHGIEQTVEVAARVRAQGHPVVVHIAARMVEGPSQIDRILERLFEIGVGDVLLISGDALRPAGPYDSALDLLPRLREHRYAPRSVGVAAYPEGHPLVDDAALWDQLRVKDGLADFCVTQMCFDHEALRRWLEKCRSLGIGLPVYIGLPGLVDRRRLIELSMSIGVGASIAFIRKQRGLRRLFRGHQATAARLHADARSLVGDELGVEGLHFFTFDRLAETVRFAEQASVAPITHQEQLTA